VLPLLLALAAAPLPGAQRCERLEFLAEAADCSPESCELAGGVVLRCADLRLWSDSLTVRFAEGGEFAGAEARGNVLLVDATTVMTCERLTIGPDRIKGRVDAATIQIKEHPEVGLEGVPQGKNKAILHGDLERPSEEELRVYDADFTLCDCGDDPPSWRLQASRIDAELEERATLWWPTVYLNPFGLGLVPVTPPLPPLSVPLKERATGFLAPEVVFLGDDDRAWMPTIDLPFFVPLGDSLDVTLSPGMRFDWEAPRAGGRVRWRPAEGTGGEARVGWTFDKDHEAAEVSFAEDIERLSDGGLTERERELADADRPFREALTHRVTVDLEQAVRLDALTWLVDVEWLSDDLIPTDFGVSLEEQVSRYVPSRTELLWRQPSLAARVTADYLLETQPIPRTNYSNFASTEEPRPHRGPAVDLVLAPVTIAGGLQVDGDAGFARSGAWSDERDPELLSGWAGLALGWRDAIGPVRLGARAAGDFLWADPDDGVARSALFPELDAEASLLFARRFTELSHWIEPRLRYAALPARPRRFGDGNLRPYGEIEERDDIRRFHQLGAGVRQVLWQAGGGARVAELEVEQPFGLDDGTLRATQARLALDAGPARFTSWAGYDWQRAAERLDDAGASLSLRFGPLALYGSWVRWGPDADRLSRSIYELAGAETASSGFDWVHTASGGVSLAWDRVRASYGVIGLLPSPEADPEEEVDGELVRPYVRQHSATLGYASPCDCWSVLARASLNREADGTWQPRGSVSLTVAGFEVGSDR
jgi:hypothetical protein